MAFLYLKVRSVRYLRLMFPLFPLIKRNRLSGTGPVMSLQHIMRRAKSTIQTFLPSIQNIFHKCCICVVSCIIKDLSHSFHCLFVPLPSGQRICCQDDEQFLFPGCQMQGPPSMCHMNIFYCMFSYCFVHCVL